MEAEKVREMARIQKDYEMLLESVEKTKKKLEEFKKKLK